MAGYPTGPTSQNFIPQYYTVPGSDRQGLANQNDSRMAAFWQNPAWVEQIYQQALALSASEQARANTAAYGSPEARETIYDVYPGLTSTLQPIGSQKNLAYDVGGGMMYGLDFSGVPGFGGQAALQKGSYTPPRTTAAAGYAQGVPAGARTSTRGGGGTFGGNASRWNVTAPGGYTPPPAPTAGSNQFDRPSRDPTTGFIFNRPAGYSGTPLGQRVQDQGQYRPGGIGTPFQPFPEGYDYRDMVAGVPAYAAANAAPSGTAWYSPGMTPSHPMAVNPFGRPPAGQNQTNTFAPPADPRMNAPGATPTTPGENAGRRPRTNTYANLKRSYGG